MKLLTLIRHGKSSWADPLTDDFDRPLNERGLRDVPRMATHFASTADKGLRVSLATSSAKRASETAFQFAKALEIPESEVVRLDKLYLPPVQQISHLVQTGIPEEVDHAIIVGHNPSLEWFLWDLIGGEPPHPMVTCAVATVKFEEEFWGTVGDQRGTLTQYLWPKMTLSP